MPTPRHTRTTAVPLPCLKAGDGLPARIVVLCDGRTSLRLSQELGGCDCLVHYAPDSWFHFSRVLSGSAPAAMRWTLDGTPHRFGWTQVWPFGYENREEHPRGERRSRCTVVQGGIVWELAGVRRAARFSIPRSFFTTLDQRDDAGRPVEVTRWTFAESARGPLHTWTAVRQEEWLLRDSSTYAGIAGAKIASEPHTSELHLCLAAGTSFTVTATAEAFAFRLRPARGGTAVLALGLGSSAAEAAAMARRLAAQPAAAHAAQLRRYAAIAADTPALDFGRHTALRRLFRLTPLYLDSMRLRDEPGAYRANNDYYWVWGWDMTRPAFGLLTGNRHDFVRRLLDFIDRADYRNQYDNSLTRDLRSDGGTPGALEFMLAHDYVAWTGDWAASRAWRAKFTAALQELVRAPDPTGMTPGAAASTDFPEEFGRTFKAWLAYPTAWHYAGLLGAEKLLLGWGDTDLAVRVRDLAGRIRHSFARVFWNPATGFWNEGVHPTDPDLVCDIPLSTAMAAMDSPYGEDLYGDRLQASAEFCAREFLREDGVWITRRGEVRGWKEWTRQPRNWFAANDTMLVRLLRSTGNPAALERLFYLYETNFGYQPCVFEGKPLHRPLHTSGSWQAFGAGAWYRNLVEGAAGLWADLGGLGIMPLGLGEPVRLTGLRFRDAVIAFSASGQGLWPAALRLDGNPIRGTTRLPPLTRGPHRVEVEYAAAVPEWPILTLAVDAEVRTARAEPGRTRVRLHGRGYTPLSFFAPGTPRLTLDGAPLPCDYDARTGRGRARALLDGSAELEITTVG